MSEEDDTLKCPICYEDYDEKDYLPRILPCHHSSCHPCLQTLIQQTRRYINCPVCRKVHNVGPRGIMEFQQNKYILTCIKMKCAKVEEVVLVEPFPRCAAHNREMTLFCENETCKQLICPRCKPAEHTDHFVVEIEEKQEETTAILNQTKEYIKQITKELYDTRMSVDEHYNLSLVEIEAAREILVGYINQHLNQEKQKIQAHKEKNIKNITECIQDFEEKTQLLEEVTKSLERMDKSALDTHLIATIKQCIPKILIEIKSMKGFKYLNKEKPCWKETIKHLTTGIVPCDLPLAVTADESMNVGNQRSISISEKEGLHFLKFMFIHFHPG